MNKSNNFTTLLDEEFKQCREALIESRKGSVVVVPECFTNGNMTIIGRDENGTWQVGGWVKKDKWVNLFLTLESDNSETKYVDGCCIYGKTA